MEVASGIVGSIVAEIAKRAFDAVFKGSIASYKDNIKRLRVQVEKLVAAKANLQNRIDEAELLNAEDVLENVRDWMISADARISEANSFVTEVEGEEKKKCSSFNFIQRSRLSKKAKNMGIEITKLLELGKFGPVARPAPLPPPIAKDYLSFESRETIMKDILEALQDPNIKMIGVYGMGGIGKTQLVKNISNQVTQSFEPVILLTIGQIPDIKLIQGQLADMLRLQFNQETELGRAAILLKRLQHEKILIIFDDIWHSLDLDKVGIPSGDDNKGCKILVTSRSKQVLTRQMGIKKIFELEDLNEQESWQLFKITVDENSIENDHEKMAIATDIVNECGKLPLAIVIVGKALQGEPLYTWKDALRQLKDPANVQIEGVSEQVYTILKWSYDHIKSPEAKSLFLLCSIFPDDHEIEIDELSTYAIGLNIIQGVNTLREAKDKIPTMVDYLYSSSLLQKCKIWGTSSLAVKMHDVVRDVAIYIASKENQMYTLSYGKGWKKWQDEKLCGGYTAIRVDCAGFEDLPLDLSFTKLELLALLKNSRHPMSNMLQIPQGCFERMGKLIVLHLKGMSFSLPSSMDCLVNLQTLLLIDCHLENIDMIGKLNKLEILDFSRSNIKELPLNLSQLSRLKQLKLSECLELKVIQPEVISRMTKLEELFLDNTFNDWEMGESNNCEEKNTNARISELGCLRCLTCLYLCIPDVRSLPEIQFLNNLKLEHFQIVIGKTWVSYYSNSEKMLDIKTDSRIDVLKELQLLERCEDLCLGGTCGVRNVVSKLKTSIQLTKLRLHHNEDVEYLVSELDPNLTFSVLETLDLIRMSRLETIINEGYSFKVFENLKTLKILSCDKMKYLFRVSIIKGLSNLESIEICNCVMMEAIVVVIENEAPVDQIQFTRLKELTLEYLPKLKSFCGKLVKAKGSIESQSNENVEEDQENSITPFHCQDAFIGLKEMELVGEEVIRELCRLNLPSDLFPALKVLKVNDLHYYERVEEYEPSLIEIFSNEEIVEVENCSKLKTMVISSPFSFQNLKQLIIYKCHRLENLFGLSVAKTLVCLNKVKLLGCNSMSTILAKRKDEREEDEIVFCELEVLELYDLPNLKMFQSAELRIRFPKLKTIEINKCPKMLTFSLGVVCTPLLQFITFIDSESNKDWAGNIRWIEPTKVWAGNINDTMQMQTYSKYEEEEDI